MLQIVVPFRGERGKQRVDAPEAVRAQLALAMLGDVLAATVVTGRTVVVTNDDAARSLATELGAETADDPGGGQGAAVQAGLAALDGGPMLVVNADVPCVVPHDLRTLAGAAELGAVGIVEADDGTTNALALPRIDLFAPLYGAESVARFKEHFTRAGVTSISAAIPNLSDDVDTLEDLRRLGVRAGPRTQAALGTVLKP